MGLRLVLIGGLVATAAVIVAGCGRDAGPSAPDVSEPSVVTAIPEPPSPPAPYADAPADVRDLCARFVRDALAYDSTAETRGAFLNRIRPVTAPAELLRLRHSERAHLPWEMLRARGESARIHITGVSTLTGEDATDPQTGPADAASAAGGSASSLSVVVEAARTTSTDLAVVREFIEVTLILEESAQGWRVVQAHGGGL